jgi:hypothetical protein
MTNSEELIREARRNGETYLSTQIELALAADQRAMTLGGILAATSSIVLGFALSGLSSSSATFFALVLSLALAISCALAFYSARPAAISPPGNLPSGWYEDISQNTPLAAALLEDLAVIQRSIEKNSRLIEGNARWLRAALIIAAMAVIFTPIIGYISTLPAASRPSTPD